MNLGIRAILYSARKWKKTLLVFCPAPGHYHSWCCLGWRLPTHRKNRPRKSGERDRGQLYGGAQLIYRGMGQW